MSVYPTIVGGFPNLFLELDLAQAPAFLKELRSVRTLDGWNALRNRYGILRNSERFWPALDWFNDWNFKHRGEEAGYLDLSYYDLLDTVLLTMTNDVTTWTGITVTRPFSLISFRQHRLVITATPIVQIQRARYRHRVAARAAIAGAKAGFSASTPYRCEKDPRLPNQKKTPHGLGQRPRHRQPSETNMFSRSMRTGGRTGKRRLATTGARKLKRQSVATARHRRYLEVVRRRSPCDRSCHRDQIAQPNA